MVRPIPQVVDGPLGTAACFAQKCVPSSCMMYLSPSKRYNQPHCRPRRSYGRYGVQASVACTPSHRMHECRSQHGPDFLPCTTVQHAATRAANKCGCRMPQLVLAYASPKHPGSRPRSGRQRSPFGCGYENKHLSGTLGDRWEKGRNATRLS